MFQLYGDRCGKWLMLLPAGLFRWPEKYCHSVQRFSFMDRFHFCAVENVLIE